MMVLVVHAPSALRVGRGGGRGGRHRGGDRRGASHQATKAGGQGVQVVAQISLHADDDDDTDLLALTMRRWLWMWLSADFSQTFDV